MHVPSPAELLGLWDAGSPHSTDEWALRVLDAAWPESSPEEIGQLSVGQRDARLMDLRRSIFGPRIEGMATCPECSESLELALDCDDLSVDAGPVSGAHLSISHATYDIQVRLPNGRDLALLAVGEHCEIDDARDWLLERCLVSANRGGESITAHELPAEITRVIAEKMGEADPQADLQLSLCCPQCGYAWQMQFDIVSYFWSEVDAWAKRMLSEVHVLASTYGWSEREIVRMSANRRQFYIDLIRG